MNRSINDANGIFSYRATGGEDAPGLILSCGIHGNETGPIEAIKRLQSELDQQRIHLAYPVLLIYGNPEAIRRNQRFITSNLNRLFGLQPKPDGAEAQRASQLEQACIEFRRQCGRVLLHLDLHSTIKPSLHPRFALQPVSSSMKLQGSWDGFFHALGIGAWVEQTQRSFTFSQFSRDALQCDSFTLECGSLEAGGPRPSANAEPDSTTPEQLYACLKALLQNQLPGQSPATVPAGNNSITRYRVQHSITRSSDAFHFLIDESEANFSRHPAGTAIYCDQQSTYRCAIEVATLFLNNSVAPGQRAGLLLALC